LATSEGELRFEGFAVAGLWARGPEARRERRVREGGVLRDLHANLHRIERRSFLALPERAYDGVMLSSPRRVAILAGVGSLILLVFAATVGRKEIATQYHLFRLRKDPVYFRSILNDPEGTPQRAAVRKYLESENGKTALISECLPPSRQMLLVGFTPAQTPHVSIYASPEEMKLTGANRLELWHNPRKPEWFKLIHEYVASVYTVTVP